MIRTGVDLAAAPLQSHNQTVRLDAVPDPHENQDGPHRDRLVYRPLAELRPYPAYQELCGPIAAKRVRRVAQQTGPIREPLLTTKDGTILDGHARWQVAVERQQHSLPCVVRSVTEEEALRVVIERHSKSVGLNDFGRILLALRLEPYLREHRQRLQHETGNKKPSSNLTNTGGTDVRVEIARVAGVSTGNVTKVKQILETATPPIPEALLRGEISIHRASQWRKLTPKEQRDALWEHRNSSGIKVQPVVSSTVLSRLATCGSADITLVVADIPGRAVILTRECYEDLLEKSIDAPS